MSDSFGNKKIMARNINMYMSKNKLERKELAEMVGSSYTTVCDWVNAKTYPRIDKIEKMAMIFGVSKADLIEEKSPLTIGEELSNMKLIRFPVIGTISAGNGCCAQEEYTGDYTYFASTDLSAAAEEHFVLRINGDSMYPKLLDGDYVLVRRSQCVESGKVAVVMFNSEEATVKKIRYENDMKQVELVPINPEYQTRRIAGADLQQFRFLGEVMKLQRDL